MKSTRTVKRAARKLFQFCVVAGELDEARVRLVGQRLVTSSQRGSLQLLMAFKRLVELDRSGHAARVESALPLDERLRDEILTRLAHLYDKKLTTTFGEDPALIAGVRVTVGSDVYDGSVRARLAAIASRL